MTTAGTGRTCSELVTYEHQKGDMTERQGREDVRRRPTWGGCARTRGWCRPQATIPHAAKGRRHLSTSGDPIFRPAATRTTGAGRSLGGGGRQSEVPPRMAQDEGR